MASTTSTTRTTRPSFPTPRARRWKSFAGRSSTARSRCRTSSEAAAIETRDVSVRYGATLAVDRVSLAAHPGEVLAIVGENGAGKSSLMNALFGLVRPAGGGIRVHGKPVAFRSARDAIAAGIGMVHQHFRLVHTLTVAENVVLGDEPRTGALVDLAAAEARVDALAKELGFSIDPRARIEDLPVGSQQRVEIVKSLARGADVLILDEPTAVLAPQESDELFRVVRALAGAGKTILFISHKLGEVAAASSRVVVMRAGRLVATLETKDTTPREISRLMVGHDVVEHVPRASHAPGGVALALAGVSARDARGIAALREVSLQVRAGEILGIAGVEGNGQAELVAVCAGTQIPDAGSIRMLDEEVTPLAPAARFARGLAHVPGDRLRDAVAVELSLEEDLLLGRQREAGFRRHALLARDRVRAFAAECLERFDVRPRDPALPFGALSGGNQQKAVIARELSRAPKVLLAAHPTRGVDVGAVEQIHRRLLAERDRGVAVLLVSADLAEILALSDRVAVLYGGRLVHETAASATDERALGAFMTGAA